jgi:hypothetical protein
MAEYEEKSIVLDDGTRVPADNNGAPYPAPHIAAEDPLLASFPETHADDSSEVEDEDLDGIDGFGYVSNPKSSGSDSGFDVTINALLKAGVRFDKTSWCRISSGSVEFSIATEK